MINVENAAKQIQKLQEKSSHVTVQTLNTIIDTFNKWYYFYEKNNEDKIVACIYRIPLLENVESNKQIYRVWWLSIESRKYTKQFILVLKKAFEGNFNLIMKTDNKVVAKKLIELWAEEFSYYKAKQKYPYFLKAYIDNSEKSEEYYKTQMFYIRKVK